MEHIKQSLIFMVVNVVTLCSLVRLLYKNYIICVYNKLIFNELLSKKNTIHIQINVFPC